MQKFPMSRIPLYEVKEYFGEKVGSLHLLIVTLRYVYDMLFLSGCFGLVDRAILRLYGALFDVPAHACCSGCANSDCRVDSG
mmetsp:Transcript_12839/g.17502  ORF Transcript_12839/g.17502 Transcript_12839/m.17502 type:complete len:82 (+) Transcript_12839:431-676(+)